MQLKLSKLTKIGNRGDTILEVIIAITIIALVLTGALALTQKSLESERSSQEHTEALQLVQSQLEELRDYVINNTAPTSPFCLYVTGTTLNYEASGSADCTINSAGIPTAAPTEPRYTVTDSPTAQNLYSVVITWNDVSGNGTDNITLYYQLYDTYVN